MSTHWLVLLIVVLSITGCSGSGKTVQPPTTAELTAMLQGNDADKQREAVHWVAQLGPNGAETTPALIVALKSPDMSVRQGAAMALGNIGPGAAPQAVPALTAALNDSESAVQQAAAEALGKMGPAAASAIPALEQLSNQPNRCNTAPAALKKIKS